jgi:thiol-disulfide isomerase/thioredoxin
MNRPLCAAAALVVSSVASTVGAQALGDVARRAESTRRTPATPAIVFDERDIDPSLAARELFELRIDEPKWPRFVDADRQVARVMAADPEMAARLARMQVASVSSLEWFLRREPALSQALAGADVGTHEFACAQFAVVVARIHTDPAAARSLTGASRAVAANAAFLRTHPREITPLARHLSGLISRAAASPRAAMPVRLAVGVSEPLAVAPPARAPISAEDHGPIDVRRGTSVPDFGFTDFDGAPRRLSDFRGKYLLLDFWGSWCGPCRAEVPYAKAAYERFRGRSFEILGLNYERSAGVDQVRALLRAQGVTWTFATADSVRSLIKQRFRVEGFPTLILLDWNGTIVETDGDLLRGDELARTLDRVLPRH